MKHLNASSLNAMLSEPGVSVVMFVAPNGDSSMSQALDLAEAWMECRDEAAFGFVNAFKHVTSARRYRIRVLPTTMIVRDHQLLAKFEGACAPADIVQAIRAAARRSVAA